MNGYSRWSVAFALICALVIASVLPADAQKKKKTPQPVQPQVQQQQPVVTPSPSPSPKPTSGIRDILAQYQGSQTNLGTLSKVASDYIMLDDDGTTVYCPLHVIQSVRVTKQDEGGVKVEIKLLSKD